jgi:hypothetical protein
LDNNYTSDDHHAGESSIVNGRYQNGGETGLSEIMNENGTVKISALNSKRIQIVEDDRATQNNSIEQEMKIFE